MNAIINLAEYRMRRIRERDYPISPGPTSRHTPSSEEQRHAVEAKRNIERLNDFRTKLAKLRSLRYRRAEHTVRPIMCTYPPEAINQALARAGRVLEGGGTIECAVYHALGGNPDGPEAA